MDNYYSITICVPKIDDEVQRNIINHLVKSELFFDCNFNILSTYSDVYRDDASTRGDSSIFSLVGMHKTDLLIVFPERFYMKNVLEDIIERAKKRNIPVISIGAFWYNTASISFSPKLTFKKIFSHLIEVHGCRRINFIGGQESNRDHDERYKQYIESLEAYGIPYEEERVGFGCYWNDPTEAVLNRFFSSKLERPEAIVCANDAMAITTLNFLKKHGYRVPKDIIVTGFDGIDMEKYHHPRITTASINHEELGKVLREYIDKIKLGEILPLQNVIEYKVRFSESCGCVPDDAETTPFIDLWNEINLDHEFNDRIIQMISSIDPNESLADILTTVSDSLSFVFSTDIRICVCSNYMQGIWDGVSYEWSGFTDTMYSIVEKINDSDTVIYTDKKFPTSRLIPNYSQMMRHTIFYPLNSREKVFGYIAANTELNHIALSQLRSFAMNMGYVLERISTHKYMEAINSRLEVAYIYDSMTGLLSRNGYYTVAKKKIEPELAKDRHIVIISVDLDNLKEINDKFGHHSGDTAIKIIAHTLQEYIGDDGIAARFGGDEFIGIKIFDGSSEKFVHDFSDGFACSIADKVEESELEYNISASFGIVSLLTKTLPSIEEGIKSADVLMYAQKRSKKKRHSL